MSWPLLLLLSFTILAVALQNVALPRNSAPITNLNNVELPLKKVNKIEFSFQLIVTGLSAALCGFKIVPGVFPFGAMTNVLFFIKSFRRMVYGLNDILVSTRKTFYLVKDASAK